MKKIFVYLALIILISTIVQAAKIHGTVYDTSLKRINGAVIEIDTKPAQRLAAVNGEYSFNVPSGDYIIKTRYVTEDLFELKSDDKITVINDGDFVLDLFLLPNLEELNETEVDVESFDLNNGKSSNKFIILIVILSIIGILILLYVLFPRKFKIEDSGKKEEKEEVKKEEIKQDIMSEDTEKVIGILKREGGRINQKDLRKMFAMSEAKMSLLIAELEHKGRVEKIKKGRGNIIILKK